MFISNIEHFLSDIWGPRYLHLKKVYLFVGISQVYLRHILDNDISQENFLDISPVCFKFFLSRPQAYIMHIALIPQEHIRLILAISQTYLNNIACISLTYNRHNSEKYWAFLRNISGIHVIPISETSPACIGYTSGMCQTYLQDISGSLRYIQDIF